MISLGLLSRVQCGRPTCITRKFSLLFAQQGPIKQSLTSQIYLKNQLQWKNLSNLTRSRPSQARNWTVCNTTNLFSLIGKRYYAKSARLPFEVDIKVPKDTLLYIHNNPRFFKMLSVFGVAQLIFWGQLALFSFTSLDLISSESGSAGIDKNTFWGKIIVMQTEYKSRIAGLCLIIGSLVAFFTYIYPRRTIRRLTLLQGGRNLQVVTYSHFARSREFTAPVDSLSVLAARAGKASQVSLKLKGHRFFYLMDKRDGKFHDTQLFDYAVGLRRNIK